MLCSVLIATRKRFDSMMRCVHSVMQSWSHKNKCEIIVRFHASDRESIRREGELLCLPDCYRIIGEDYDGYLSLGRFYSEMLSVATGDWCFHLNDDMTVFGEDWDLKLKQVPTTGFLVQPEYHQLNNSVYALDQKGPAPIHPRGAVSMQALIDCGPATDDCIYNETVIKKHWGVKFLEGVGINHHWGGVESHVA